MNLIQCQGIDSLEVIIGWRNCDYNDRKKRVKNMDEIYEKCALWILKYTHIKTHISKTLVVEK
jgi:hypothetical protein